LLEAESAQNCATCRDETDSVAWVDSCVRRNRRSLCRLSSSFYSHEVLLVPHFPVSLVEDFAKYSEELAIFPDDTILRAKGSSFRAGHKDFAQGLLAMIRRKQV
jgi:hypothetical protein